MRVSDGPVFDKIAAQQRRDILDELQRDLTDEGRDVIFLRYYYGLTTREIALATGSNSDAVRQMHGRCLIQLREGLAAYRTGIRRKEHI